MQTKYGQIIARVAHFMLTSFYEKNILFLPECGTRLLKTSCVALLIFLFFFFLTKEKYNYFDVVNNNFI